MQRREFFTNIKYKFKQERKSLSPPYLHGSLYECVKCDAPCIKVCETDVLFKNSQNFIEVDFSKQGCTYCSKCANVCFNNVLSLKSDTQYIKASFFIDKISCLAHNGVMCMSCKDPCIYSAINFKALFEPVIDLKVCTSCGFCIACCPTLAIKFLN